MVETRTLGWIGLGKMGLPISTRLVSQGYKIVGYDRDPQRVAEAVAAGVTPASSLDEAAGQSIVFTSLPDDKALRAVMLDGPLLERMGKGSILVETSTVSPGISASVAEAASARGIACLRAPVSGNAAIAHTGNLTCFVSGPNAAFETVLPVLKDFTRAQKYLGVGEEARFAKLAVNLMIAVSAAMMGESIVLARKGNLAWQDILDVLTNSAVGSPMVHYKAKSLETRDFSSTFSCSQMAKDLDLIIAAGHGAQMSTPLAAQTREIYGALIGRGEGDADFISTVRLAEWLAGLEEPELNQNDGRLA